MKKEISYKHTVLACYVANFSQAVVINLTPILFIPLRQLFGFSFEQLGMLIFINFVTQIACDVLFSGAVDRHGFRPFIVTAPLLAIVGFLSFAFAPNLFPTSPFIGFVVGTVIFSGAGGLLELLLSPIVNAIPTKEKEAAMSMLHSFYSWGQVTVVLLTTLFLFFFGQSSWRTIVLLWTILPAIAFLMFCVVPLAPGVPEHERQSAGQVARSSFFVVATLLIAFGAAAEICMGQWASAFLEKGLGLSKVVGDTAGVCLFALMMGIGRLLYGIYGNKINVTRVMLIGAATAAVCYVTVALSPYSLLSVAACGISGIAVSLLWPGTVVIAAARFPKAGAWMFAILAAAGDTGAAVGPWLLGLVTDHVEKIPLLSSAAQSLQMTAEQFGLHSAMLAGGIFPLGAAVCLLFLCRGLRKPQPVADAYSQESA